MTEYINSLIEAGLKGITGAVKKGAYESVNSIFNYNILADQQNYVNPDNVSYQEVSAAKLAEMGNPGAYAATYGNQTYMRNDISDDIKRALAKHEQKEKAYGRSFEANPKNDDPRHYQLHKETIYELYRDDRPAYKALKQLHETEANNGHKFHQVGYKMMMELESHLN